MGFFIIIPIQKNLLPHLHNYFSIFTLIFFAFFSEVYLVSHYCLYICPKLTTLILQIAGT